jgi:hypothetical protein
VGLEGDEFVLDVLGLERLRDGDGLVGANRRGGVGGVDVLEVGFHVLLCAYHMTTNIPTNDT